MAIALFFRRNVYSVRTAYTKQDIHGLGPSTSDFYERAIKICCDVGLIARHDDDFGPVSYTKTERSELADRELDERYPVFARYYQQADGVGLARRSILEDHLRVDVS